MAVKDVALARAKALPKVPDSRVAAKTVQGEATHSKSLAETLLKGSAGPMSQASKNIQSRITQEKALNKEVGGRNYSK